MLSPVTFQRQLLKRRLWQKQIDICNLAAYSPRRSLSIKGCHGSGKTFVVAGLVPYFICSDQEYIVLTIAPTLRQVKLMWNEITAAIQVMPARFPEPTTTGWRFSETNYALGFSAAKGVNAQGFHGKRILIIADEAIGIGPDLWDAVEGIRSAGDVRIIKLCNPTVPEGAPYDDFTKLRSETDCITISAFDTPNLAGLTLQSLLELPDAELDIAPVPWLTRRRWVREMYHKWGPANPRFVSRVLGEFPAQAANSVFQLGWIERAGMPYEPEQLARDLSRARNPYIQIGFDVAGPGDDETAACARLGPYVLASDAWADADPTAKAERFIARLQEQYPGMPIVMVGDTVGIGHYFMRHFARQGFDVRAFVAGAAPVDPVMFANAKAEAYWRLREAMRENGVYGVVDEDTQAQLSDVRYRELASGRLEIEHKDEVRARGSSSPDRAEALIIAFVKIVPREQIEVLGGAGSYQISAI